MLPQGFSPILKARPSQQVDIDWGNSIHQLKDIMSNTVASKLFDHKTILCVGPEMVSQPKGRRVGSKTFSCRLVAYHIPSRGPVLMTKDKK
jgi:hypothetical protein